MPKTAIPPPGIKRREGRCDGRIWLKDARVSPRGSFAGGGREVRAGRRGERAAAGLRAAVIGGQSGGAAPGQCGGGMPSRMSQNHVIRKAVPEDAEAIAEAYRTIRAACHPYLPVLHTAEEDVAFFRRHLS